MRLLLDTQVALWWLTSNARLSEASRRLMADSPCFVSVASVWEVALKHRLGKLPITPKRFRDEMRIAGATILSITADHILTELKSVEAHRDPFDRLLLSVAESENLILLTADAALVALGRAERGLPLRRA